MRPMVAARAVLALAAVLMIAWSAVLVRNLDTGLEAVAKRDPEGLDSARFLDPGGYWDRVLASIYLYTGDNRRAAAEAEAIVRSEPDNLAAWNVLRQATIKTDPRRSAEAAAAIRRLDPLGSGP